MNESCGCQNRSLLKEQQSDAAAWLLLLAAARCALCSSPCTAAATDLLHMATERFMTLPVLGWRGQSSTGGNSTKLAARRRRRSRRALPLAPQPGRRSPPAAMVGGSQHSVVQHQPAVGRVVEA